MSLDTFLSIIGAAATVIGGAWALMKVFARQFNASLDERFAAQEEIRKQARASHEKRFERLEGNERDFHQFKTEVHRDFVRRDDYVRDIASIKVMIDNLGLNVERKLTEIWQEMRGRQ